MEEFRKYDRNSDGIITTEEAMRTVPKPATPTVAANTTPSTTNATPAGSAAPPTPTPSAVASAPASGNVTMSIASGNRGAPGAPLSDDEIKRRVDMSFQYVDENKDGFLDSREISEKAFSIRTLDWKKYDTNGDGKLDRAELTALYKAEGRGTAAADVVAPVVAARAVATGIPDTMARTMFNNMESTGPPGRTSQTSGPGISTNSTPRLLRRLRRVQGGSAKMRDRRGGGGGGREGGGGGPQAAAAAAISAPVASNLSLNEKDPFFWKRGFLFDGASSHNVRRPGPAAGDVHDQRHHEQHDEDEEQDL